MLNADIDVDDVENKEGQITVFVQVDDFYKAKQAFSEAFPEAELDVQEISFLPQTNVEINGDDVPVFEKFITMLNDCEDVAGDLPQRESACVNRRGRDPANRHGPPAWVGSLAERNINHQIRGDRLQAFS